METLIRDLKYAARTLRRSPGFTLFATLTLALGIGANSAIFAIVNAVILRPLPFPDAERLVMLWEDHRARQGPEREWTSPPTFLDWQEASQSFASMAAFGSWTPTLTGAEGSERLTGLTASHNIFRVLETEPVLGRAFLPEEDKPGASRVVVLSHEFWQQQFGGDSTMVGRAITLDSEPYHVVGILPPNTRFIPLDGVSPTPHVWTPIRLDPAACDRSCLTLRVMARLGREANLESAQLEMERIGTLLEEEFHENRGVGVVVVPLRAQVAGEIRPALLVLVGAVGFVLLIACANVANLLLARGAMRQNEIAVRLMLGAGRSSLTRQMLTESLVLALLGGAGGVLLAFWAVDLLVTAVPPGMDVPQLDLVRVDGAVLAFSLGVALVTGALFGIIPSIHAARPGLNRVLKEEAKSSGPSPSGSRIRGTLVVGEVAVAIVLLVGAGLLMKSFARLMSVDRGFDEKNVLTMHVALPPTLYPEPSDVRDLMGELVANLGRVRDVEIAAAGSTIPLGGADATVDFIIEGRSPPGPGSAPPVAWYRIVTPDYLEALRIPLLGGRGITPKDHADAPPVAVINETLARKHWPAQEPVGQYLILDERRVAIVGIAGDIRNWGLEQGTRPALYLSYQQFSARTMNLVLRTRAEPTEIADDVRREIARLDPALALSRMASLEGVVASSVGQRRLTTLLLGIFSAAALVLAAIGLYGVLSYTVTRRKHEIGVRVALGASAATVRARVVGHGLTLATLGTLLGLLASLAIYRLVASLLYGVTPNDPMIFASVPLLLSLVAMLASYIPARQATRVDPVVALRAE